LLALVAYLDFELAERNSGRDTPRPNRREWWTHRSLAALLGIPRSQVASAQIAALLELRRQATIARLYASICEAMAEVLEESEE